MRLHPAVCLQLQPSFVRLHMHACMLMVTLCETRQQPLPECIIMMVVVIAS
jgi:hypothetical protein